MSPTRCGKAAPNQRVGDNAHNYSYIRRGLSLRPGPVVTDMNTAFLNDPEAARRLIANVPVGRWGQVKEIGSLACYLCSEDAGFITGTDILIDGGWTAK